MKSWKQSNSIAKTRILLVKEVKSDDIEMYLDLRKCLKQFYANRISNGNKFTKTQEVKLTVYVASKQNHARKLRFQIKDRDLQKNT